jgi:hypothetical protein
MVTRTDFDKYQDAFNDYPDNIIPESKWKQLEQDIKEIAQKKLDKIVPDKRVFPKLKFQPRNKTKLGNIAHFSTMPYDTCFVNCKYCYALKSTKRYPTVKACYVNNQERLDKGEKLPSVPKNRSIVRMYVSGDFQSIYVISEWIRLARENKTVTFYGYTKQFKNKKDGFLPMLNILRMMPNVVLRASVDATIGYNVPSGWVKAGILEDNKKDGRFFVCKSNNSTGLKCEKCKVCFLPKFQHIPVYFPAH